MIKQSHIKDKTIERQNFLLPIVLFIWISLSLCSDQVARNRARGSFAETRRLPDAIFESKTSQVSTLEKMRQRERLRQSVLSICRNVMPCTIVIYHDVGRLRCLSLGEAMRGSLTWDRQKVELPRLFHASHFQLNMVSLVKGSDEARKFLLL